MISFTGAQFPREVILFAVFLSQLHGVLSGLGGDHGREAHEPGSAFSCC